MKPKLETVRSNKREEARGSALVRLPLTDCNYHSVALGEYNGQCAKASSPSFLNISRGYFKNEARHDFISEAAFFVAIIVTAAWPVAYGVYVIGHLIRATGVI